MPIQEKNKSLHLDDEDSDEDLSHPRRFLEMPCGTLIAYGGEEGTIAARNKDTGDFQVLHRYNDMIRAVAVSSDGKRVVVGCDDGSTLVYPFEDYDAGANNQVHPFCEALYKKKDDEDDLLLSQDYFSAGMKSFPGPQLELPVRDIQFVKDYILAIASESGLVLVNVDSSSTLLERSLEHEVREQHASSGIRGVALFQKFMATLAMDGRLCLWDTETKALVEREGTTCIPRKDVGEIHGADAFDRSCRPTFYPLSDTEAILTTPGKLLPGVRWFADNELHEMELENTKPDEGHIEPIVAMQFLKHTEDTRYVVTSGRDARVVLWKWHDGIKITPLETFNVPNAATDLLLQGSQILAASANGTYSTMELSPHVPKSILPAPKVAVAPSTTTATTTNTTETQKTDSTSVEEPKSNPTKKVVTKKVKELGSLDSDSSDDEGLFDKGGDEKTNTSTSPKNRVRFVDDEAEEDNDEDLNETTANDKKTNDKDATKSSDDNDDVDSLDDHISFKKTADDLDDVMDDMDQDLGHYRPASDDVPPMRMSPSVPPQAAFSPSSTPLDLARRFLCWNHIGVLTLLHGDDRNTVDITFTDSAYKRPISFTDNMNFILGSLGEDGGIFATDLQLDDDDDASVDGLDGLNMSENTRRAVLKSQKKGGSKATGSTIFFYRYTSIGSLREKDWYLNLPVGERVWGAATGEGWAAVSTSRKYLRFLSTGGNQGQIFWLKGDPVTMTGRGRFLAVVYHDSTPLEDGTQQLACQLWDATTCEVLSEGPLSCLNKGASLTWLGFSNDLSLMAMDSDGMMSMLIQSGSKTWEWAPVLDTMGLRKSMDDHFWPITVYDGKMVCVPLKGGNTYPDAARKPVTSTLGLRLPLAASTGGKT